MKRGDLLTVIVPGDYGKPRPAVVVQSDFAQGLDSVIVCMITSDLSSQRLFRIDLPSNPQTGLRKPSQIMTDKMFTSYREKCGPVIGRLNVPQIAELNDALTFVMGLVD